MQCSVLASYSPWDTMRQSLTAMGPWHKKFCFMLPEWRLIKQTQRTGKEQWEKRLLISEEQSTGSPTIKREEVQGVQQRPPRWLGWCICSLWTDVEGAGLGSDWKRGRERRNSLLVPIELIQTLHNSAWHKEKEGINWNKIW